MASAPISWGVCEVPGWGFQMDVDRVLREMAALGMTATEFGPPGFLPADGAAAKEMLASHGLTAVGGFAPIVLHDPDHDPETEFIDFLTACRAAGGDTMVLACATGVEGYDGRPELTPDGWAALTSNLARAQELAASFQVMAVVHPHIGTMIETPDEVQQLLESSSIPLCLDTGHILVGGGDPVELARQAGDRVAHVHFKDVRLDLVRRVQSGEMQYSAAVRDGMYCTLGVGDVDLPSMVDSLQAVDYAGWYIIELDHMLQGAPSGEGPMADVRTSIDYLGSLGLQP